MVSVRPLALAAGVSILCLFAAVGGYRYGVSQQKAHYEPILRAHAETAREADARARRIEREAAERAVAAADKLAKENADALAERDRTIADLRDGNLRLRDRFTACNRRVSEIATDSRSGDGGTEGGLQPADAEFLISIAAEADAVVRQLQACQALHR